MNQGVQDILAVSFACPTTIEVGDIVEISADNTVAKIAGIGSVDFVGVVCSHIPGAAFCTVATRFRERRDDRLAGVTVTPGAFVWGPSQQGLSLFRGFVRKRNRSKRGDLRCCGRYK